MRSLPYKTLALIFAIIFTAGFFIGFYVFSDRRDPANVSAGGLDDAESVNRNASIPQ